MRLAVNKLTALRALRVFRSEGGTLPAGRCDLPAPDPSPQQRWTARVVPLERLGLATPPDKDHQIDVVVPSAEARVRSSFVSCSVRSTSLPPRSFVDLDNGLFIPCPELLFYELADVMTPEAHALLGYELCGTFSRDVADPRTGKVTYDVTPVTSVEKIAAYLRSLGDRPGARLARHNLARVADNAWSPMEAIVSLMARLPVHDLGYGLGTTELNVRHGATPELAALGCKESRVPDIEIAGTHVGFNYDSRLHFDLEAIAEAGSTSDPHQAIEAVREKYRDDLQRNRELAAMGHIILPVTSADLFEPGGLDAVMLEAAMVIDELDGGHALSNVTAALLPESERRQRQELIWSLLPWDAGVQHARRRQEQTQLPWWMRS